MAAIFLAMNRFQNLLVATALPLTFLPLNVHADIVFTHKLQNMTGNRFLKLKCKEIRVLESVCLA